VTLAPWPDDPGDEDGGERYVVFRARGAWYGAPVAEVKEILALAPVTEVPGAGPHVVGVVIVRGAMVTLLDLPSLLHDAATPEGAATDALVVELEGEPVALQVDEVARVDRVPARAIEAPHEIVGGVPPHVLGVARTPGRPFVTLLDLGALLASFDL